MVEPVRDWERQVYQFLDEDVPEDVLDHGELVVADVLAATVGGAGVEFVERAGEEAALTGGDCTVLGVGRRVSPGEAATLNGMAAITQEIEEGHNTGGHVGAGIVTGALALGERAEVDGETFVAACVKAYELCARLEYAIFAMKAELNEAVDWLLRDPHSTWTTVGPAVAGALCLGLDGDELRETFRTAANLAVVSMHDAYEEGPPARNLTAGLSAQAGVTVPLLTATGFAGSASAIPEVYDPLRDLLAEGEFDGLFAELGDRWEVTRNYFKPYPSCRYTHPALDALRDALGAPEEERRVDPDDVSSVTVRTFANAVDMANPSPSSFTGAKFSIPYVLARYLVSGSVSLDHFSPDAVDDRAVRSLASRVSVEHDPEMESTFPDDWPASVEVALDGGETLRASRPYPRGDHRDPIPRDALFEKYASLCEFTLGDEADRALDALSNVRTRSVPALADALSRST